MKSKFDVGPDKANEHLEATKKMIEHAKKLLKMLDQPSTFIILT
jgi:hypothetical protein